MTNEPQRTSTGRLGFNLPRVKYSKCKKEIQGKLALVRVSMRFELLRV